MKEAHLPVLLDECVEAFDGLELSLFLDGTLGAGGHSEAILRAHPEIQKLIGIDQDPEARLLASERLAPWKEKLLVVEGNFTHLTQRLAELGLPEVDGMLFDLGVSSMQLDQGEKGFSFMKEGPLDMRMDPSQELTAAVIVNEWPEQELCRIFRDYGEESRWRVAAKAIVTMRKQKRVTTTQELVALLLPVFPSVEASRRRRQMHPMTLVFQALRICVNGELEVLEALLPQAIAALRSGGRLGVISYHSLEDRIVKNCFRFYADDKYDTTGVAGMFLDKEPVVKLLTRKPLVSGEEEVARNPRARSAKLRFIEKL